MIPANASGAPSVGPSRIGTSVGPRVGLALGGGGARGLAHIHVVEALDELGIRPAVIAGSSIGAIIGAGVAAGMSGREIGDHARSILSRRSQVIGRIWSTRPASLTEMVQNGLRMTQFDIEKVVKAFLPAEVPERFDQLSIPLKVTATDFYGHKPAVFESGDLHSALAASAALPAIFSPVRREGVLYIDGGFFNPVPFDLLADQTDIVVAVDVVGAPGPVGDKGPTTMDLMFGASQLMMQAIISGKLAQGRPHVMLRPAVSRFRVLDFLKIEQLLAETSAVKDELKRALAPLLEAHRPAAIAQAAAAP